MVKHSCMRMTLDAEHTYGFFLIWNLGCSPDDAGRTEVRGAVSTPHANVGRVGGLENSGAADALGAPAVAT